MIIRGVSHYAQIIKTQDAHTHRELFRYTLQAEDNPKILYWGFEQTEDSAREMANMYLNLLDQCVIAMRWRQGPAPDRVQFMNTPQLMRA